LYLNAKVLAMPKDMDFKLFNLQSFFTRAKEQALGSLQVIIQVGWDSQVVVFRHKFQRDVDSLFSNVDYKKICMWTLFSNVDYYLEICIGLIRWRWYVWFVISNLDWIPKICSID